VQPTVAAMLTARKIVNEVRVILEEAP